MKYYKSYRWRSLSTTYVRASKRRFRLDLLRSEFGLLECEADWENGTGWLLRTLIEELHSFRDLLAAPPSKEAECSFSWEVL